MRFRYTAIRNNQDPTNPFQRPYLSVRLIHGAKHKDVISLVDSGAELNQYQPSAFDITGFCLMMWSVDHALIEKGISRL